MYFFKIRRIGFWWIGFRIIGTEPRSLTSMKLYVLSHTIKTGKNHIRYTYILDWISSKSNKLQQKIHKTIINPTHAHNHNCTNLVAYGTRTCDHKINMSRSLTLSAQPQRTNRNPALCGSWPPVIPYYCRLGDLLCYTCMLYMCPILCVCICEFCVFFVLWVVFLCRFSFSTLILLVGSFDLQKLSPM